MKKLWIILAIGAAAGAFVVAENKKIRDGLCKCADSIKEKVESKLNDDKPLM